MAPNYLELLERAQTGPSISKEDWDMDKVVIATRKLVKKYQIAWDPGEIIPLDPGIADRVFNAGLELAQTSGVFQATTGRIIEFQPGELEEALRAVPQSLVMGEGADARTLKARQILDPSPPLVWAGNPGVPTPEELFQPMVMSWMQEPVVDLVTCGSLTQVDGYDVRTAEPAEITATRRELKLMREGLVKVGRPGMGMLAAQSSVSELGDLAVANPVYLRPCDAHLVPIIERADHRSPQHGSGGELAGVWDAQRVPGLCDGWRFGGRCPGRRCGTGRVIYRR